MFFLFLKKLTQYSVAVLLIVTSTPALSLCGGPLSANAFSRPIDYNSKKEIKNIRLVEEYHFTPEVEAFVKGKSDDRLEMEFDYTLRQIPNHYRALNAMATWQIRNDHRNHEHAEYLTAECYFERAIEFKPQDPVLHMLKAIYLHKKKKTDEALKSYKKSLDLDPNYAEAHYNLGLLYYDTGKYKDARKHAELAYKSNYPLPGLRKKLKAVKAW